MNSKNPAPDVISPEYVYVGSSNPWADLRKVFALIKHLTQRNLADRYRGSRFGFLWSFLTPILMMVVYGFVFRYVFRATIPNIPYPVFFLTGFLAWNFFISAVTGSAATLTQGGYLIRKVYFPRIVLPLSAILSNLVNFIISLPILLVFNAFFGIFPGWSFLLLPLALLLLLIVSTGIGLIFASIAPFFRDILELLQILFVAWFFATPVIYPMSMLSKHLSPMLIHLYMLNPMVGVIQFVQSALLGQTPPLRDVFFSFFVGLCLLTFACWLFSRCSRYFSDYIK